MHWQLMLTAFYFGLRVSEVVNILGEDVQDGQLGGEAAEGLATSTLQPIPSGDEASSDAFRLDLDRARRRRLARAVGCSQCRGSVSTSS